MTQTLIKKECPHFDGIPEAIAWCAICCKTSSTYNEHATYSYKKEKVLVQTERPRVGEKVMYYPYRDSIPYKAGLVHVSGNWRADHIIKLVEKVSNLYIVEFAPSQEPLLESWLQYFIDQPNGSIGVELRNRKGGF